VTGAAKLSYLCLEEVVAARRCSDKTSSLFVTLLCFTSISGALMRGHRGPEVTLRAFTSLEKSPLSPEVREQVVLCGHTVLIHRKLRHNEFGGTTVIFGEMNWIYKGGIHYLELMATAAQ